MRKKTLLLLLGLLPLYLLGQELDAFSFQTFIRNDAGSPLSNKLVTLEIQIKNDQQAAYIETHTSITENDGSLTINVGHGTIKSGNFTTIDWSKGSYFLHVNIDKSAGNTYQPHTILQLQDRGVKASRVASKVPQTLSFDADQLGDNPQKDIIENVGNGLRWENHFAEAATLIVRKPPNYNGGTVNLILLFQTTSEEPGKVGFFVRPRSFNKGDDYSNIINLPTATTEVTSKAGPNMFYEVDIQIPESRLEKDWWYITIQRSQESYPKAVIVKAVALEFEG